MATHVAFLRAINVGGHAVVKMAALREAFEAAGCKNVRTYIQSGNVVFDAPAKGHDALLKKIHARVTALVGVEASICFRTLEEIEALIASDPFAKYCDDPAAKLYVAFLADKPKVAAPFPASLPKEALEAIAIKGREVFVISRPKPDGSYGFPNISIEKACGVPATTRNWTTITKVADLGRR